MKRIACLFATVAFTAAPILSYGTESHVATDKKKGESAVKAEIKNHFKLYGFIRNYFAFDTRESVAGTADLYYWLPKDRELNTLGQDLNAKESFRFVVLTSRVGLDVSGYSVGRTSFGAKVEADFYAGLSGSTGTATMRLRQAYMTIGWKDLAMCGKKENKASVVLKIGQAWHPIAADQPSVISLETGAPFNPFSRTPQVTMDASLGKHFVITASALWQMQYTSNGPAKSSADYIKYGCTPEVYLGLTFKAGSFLSRAGVDVLSIKPRWKGTIKDNENNETTVRVSDRITTVSPYFYAQYSCKSLVVKAKTVYGSAGEHVNLMSGYGVTAKFDATGQDGHWEYTPLHSSSTWLSIQYGKKWQGMLMGGYIKNLGTSKELVNTDGTVSESDIFFQKNGFKNINSMWRIVPAVAYNIGKFTLALEYNYTAVQYGDGKSYDVHGLSTSDLHWIGNHRVQMMAKFTF